MKLEKLLIDPASGNPSMSRLCYGFIVLATLGLAGVLVWQGKDSPGTDLLKTALITTAGLYGANSVAGVITRKGELPKEGPPCPPGPPGLPPPSGTGTPFP